jgi:hypothetical protein
MYYDISKKDEDFFWEIPVNAELLVTNLQNPDDKINGHYYQYDYDTTTKKHVRGDKLKCNTFAYNDFIYNFYKDKNYIEVKNNNQP